MTYLSKMLGVWTEHTVKGTENIEVLVILDEGKHLISEQSTMKAGKTKQCSRW